MFSSTKKKFLIKSGKKQNQLKIENFTKNNHYNNSKRRISEVEGISSHKGKKLKVSLPQINENFKNENKIYEKIEISSKIDVEINENDDIIPIKRDIFSNKSKINFFKAKFVDLSNKSMINLSSIQDSSLNSKLKENKSEVTFSQSTDQEKNDKKDLNLLNQKTKLIKKIDLFGKKPINNLKINDLFKINKIKLKFN